MKRANNLFPVLISDENLNRAITEVNKSHRRLHHSLNKCTLWVEQTRDERVKELRSIIENGFVPSPDTEMMEYDSNARKWRTIHKPEQWPDQYVHHALIQVLHDSCMRGMDYWCCGSIPGRGVHFGAEGIKRWMRNDVKGTRHVLTMDIRHFYDELKPIVVMNRFRQLIKDHRTLDLLWRVIENGVKVGFYSSQWCANTVLQPLDRLIREDGACTHYVRYMDNMTIFGPNKRKLRRLKVKIEKWLKKHYLRVKTDWQVFSPYYRLPNALGYRYGRDYTIPRKLSFLKLKRNVRKCQKLIREGKPIPYKLAASCLSRLGMIKHCSNHNLYKILFKGEKKFQKKLKRVVSEHDKVKMAKQRRELARVRRAA